MEIESFVANIYSQYMQKNRGERKRQVNNSHFYKKHNVIAVHYMHALIIHVP